MYYKSDGAKSRLPKGFRDRFQLRLTKVEKGSAVPILERAYSEEVLPGVEDEYDEARDLVSETIDAFSSGQPLPAKFPPTLLRLFEGFGKSLKDDESIELCKPNSSSGSAYNREVRLKLLSFNNRNPISKVCHISGSVSGFDVEDKNFSLVLDDGRNIRGPLAKSFDVYLRDAAKNYEDIAVRLVGIGRYAADNTLQSLEKIQHLTLFQNDRAKYCPDIESRLAELKSLEAGWHDGIGSAYDHTFLDAAKAFLTALVIDSEIPSPFIYPSPDGTLEAEWSLGYWEISASFEWSQKRLFLHATQVEGEEIREDSFGFDDPSSVQKTEKFLREFLRTKSADL